MFWRMDKERLFFFVLILADAYMLWYVLSAPRKGVISTKWRKVYRSENPNTFWITFWVQLLLAAVLFPILIYRMMNGLPID
jgi:hypothetical protein